MGIAKLLGKPNKLRDNDLRLTTIPSRGNRNTPSHFMLQNPGISSDSYDPVGSKASFFWLCITQSGFKPWPWTICSIVRQYTLLSQCLSSTPVYKWVPANLMVGISLWWTSIPSRDIPSPCRLKKREDKLLPDGPLGLWD